jgi:hypothetical protein
MTKTEAIAEMEKGKKIKHIGFSSDEWMTIQGGKILLEDGVICDHYEFWRWRREDYWKDGYSLWN